MNNNFNAPQNDNFDNEINPTMHPGKAAIYGLIIVFFLFQFGGGLLFLAIFGTDLSSANVNAVRLFNVAGQLLFILAPTIMLAKLVYVDKVSPVLRIKLPTIKEVVIFIVGLVILIPLLQSFIYVQNYIIQQLADSFSIFQHMKNFADDLDKLMESSYGIILNAQSLFEIVFVVLVVSITPAICEEVFFRGFTQKSLEYSMKPFWAILITSFAFALYHFNPYGLLALTILAMYLGFAAYQSKSIVIPMTLHFINNFISILAYFIWGSDELMNTSIVKPDEFSLHIILLLLLTILFFFFLFYLKKNYYKFQ
ncbi:MAG: CPBP family intramembrane metalloprotease [Bacteroidetes bacterium]|nr:CPBP family intramembrane metalloprotease [Bacteroidota bacterium]MBU1114261.1 CPBP family intramembrane metalloprotease [Bacteroidota bacterium]MBU1797675.1 CPBP family intramembrane metalloprotease [Bacteroidota bacterium]